MATRDGFRLLSEASVATRDGFRPLAEASMATRDGFRPLLCTILWASLALAHLRHPIPGEIIPWKGQWWGVRITVHRSQWRTSVPCRRVEVRAGVIGVGPGEQACVSRTALSVHHCVGCGSLSLIRL